MEDKTERFIQSCKNVSRSASKELSEKSYIIYKEVDFRLANKNSLNENVFAFLDIKDFTKVLSSLDENNNAKEIQLKACNILSSLGINSDSKFNIEVF